MPKTLKEKKEERKFIKSMMSIGGEMDIWVAFKVMCIKKQMSIKDGLKDALMDWMKKWK